MQVFSGLYVYEIVLLCLGALLFLVLVGALLFLLVKGQAYARLLWFFPVSIVMMGFPAFSTIKIKGDLLVLEKQTRQLEQTPADPIVRAELSKTVQAVTARTFSDSTALTAVAKAQIALGQETRAQTTANQALQADPSNQEAATVNAQVQAAQELPQVTRQVEQNPADAKAKETLQQTLRVVTRRAIVDPALLAKVAQAQAAAGETEKAQVTARTANQIDPNLKLKIDPKRYQVFKPQLQPTVKTPIEMRKVAPAPTKQ